MGRTTDLGWIILVVMGFVIWVAGRAAWQRMGPELVWDARIVIQRLRARRRRRRRRSELPGGRRGLQVPVRRRRRRGRRRPVGPGWQPGGSAPEPEERGEPAPTDAVVRSTEAEGPAPLAELRELRDWIDLVEPERVAQVLHRVRWGEGRECPDCGERDPRWVRVIEEDADSGRCRCLCLVCAGAGDAGEGGSFNDLSGTALAGMRLDLASFFLILKGFVAGQAAVRVAAQVGVNRLTVDRYFRLLRAVIFVNRSSEPIALGPEDICEGDEVYITAGLKGNAGGEELERPPRERGLKRRGRGTWESDRVPVLGLLCRGGEVRLVVLRNVQTDTIRPFIEQAVARGARFYTDGYGIYHYLTEAGYQHETVNHSAGEYARGEVHCNTMEATWSWLRQYIRTFRGVSKVYLPLYVAQFEFFYNRRHDHPWDQMLELLQLLLHTDPGQVLPFLEGTNLAQLCPVPG